MFKSLNRGISSLIAIIIIVVLAVIVDGGILVYQYKFAPKESEFTLTPPPKDETANWKTYRNEEYGFEVMYPATGWSLTTNMIGSILGREPLDIKNLYTQRAGNPEVDELSTNVTFAVHKKAINLSMIEWLSSALKWLSPTIPSPSTIRGDISVGLKRANAGDTGLLVYDESKNDDIEISKFGAISPIGYFDYTTCLHKVGSPYVYSIELYLPLRGSTVTDTDEKYINTYNQILSTFRFLK